MTPCQDVKIKVEGFSAIHLENEVDSPIERQDIELKRKCVNMETSVRRETVLTKNGLGIRRKKGLIEIYRRGTFQKGLQVQD